MHERRHRFKQAVRSHTTLEPVRAQLRRLPHRSRTRSRECPQLPVCELQVAEELPRRGDIARQREPGQGVLLLPLLERVATTIDRARLIDSLEADAKHQLAEQRRVEQLRHASTVGARGPCTRPLYDQRCVPGPCGTERTSLQHQRPIAGTVKAQSHRTTFKVRRMVISLMLFEATAIARSKFAAPMRCASITRRKSAFARLQQDHTTPGVSLLKRTSCTTLLGALAVPT
eukprot:6214809-Pleurochrysis_carterae.AAC.4